MKQIKLTNEEIASVCQSLAHLLHAGLTPSDALFLLAQDAPDGEILSAMAKLADDGVSLSQCFRSADCFPAYVCTLLAVGEQVGRCEETLSALSGFYHARSQMSRRLRIALLYPAVLLGVLLAVLVILLVWVFPVFYQVYAQLGASLTGIAGALYQFGQALGTILPVIGLVLVLCGLLLAIPPLRQKGLQFGKKYWGDRGAFRFVNNARFLQALYMAAESGMPHREAVLLAASLAEAPGFSKRCQQCLASLDAGASLAQALRDADYLSASDCRLLEAGIRSGSSEKVLASLAADSSVKSEEHLERAAGRLEPAMVMVACVLIGTVLLSVMLPLMNIMAAIG